MSVANMLKMTLNKKQFGYAYQPCMSNPEHYDHRYHSSSFPTVGSIAEGSVYTLCVSYTHHWIITCSSCDA